MSAALARAPEAAILERLKHETRPQHDAIERNALFGRLMAPDLSIGEYRAVLEKLLGFHRAIEPEIARALPAWAAPLELRRRARAPVLAADLEAFGVNSGVVPVHPSGLVRTPAEAWGALYVLEGSTLGGRVILKRVAVSLGLASGPGVQHLEGHGAHTGEMWMRLRALLAEAAQAEPHMEDAIVAAAGGVFSALDAWVAT